MITMFENSRFIVEVWTNNAEPIEMAGAKFTSYYVVRNKDTGVVEVQTPGLVEAIMYAENCDRMLDTRPWEWARQAQSVAEALAEAPTGPTN